MVVVDADDPRIAYLRKPDHLCTKQRDCAIYLYVILRGTRFLPFPDYRQIAWLAERTKTNINFAAVPFLISIEV